MRKLSCHTNRKNIIASHVDGKFTDLQIALVFANCLQNSIKLIDSGTFTYKTAGCVKLMMIPIFYSAIAIGC